MSRKTATATKDDLFGTTPKQETPVAKRAATASRQLAAVPTDNTPKNILAVIAKCAADPRVLPEKMRLLLDMQKEIMAEEARLAFIADFGALQAELPSIGKDGKIEIRAKDDNGKRTENSRIIQATPYATFNNIMKVCKPLLTKNNFTIAFENGSIGERLNNIGILTHARGHERRSSFPLPAETSGSKNNVQGWGSAATYGKRYNTIALLNIISSHASDGDNDGYPQVQTKTEVQKQERSEPPVEEGVVMVSKPQLEILMDEIQNCGVSFKKFCEKYGIAKVADLPAAQFQDAIKACKNFASART